MMLVVCTSTFFKFSFVFDSLIIPLKSIIVNTIFKYFYFYLIIYVYIISHLLFYVLSIYLKTTSHINPRFFNIQIPICKNPPLFRDGLSVLFIFSQSFTKLNNQHTCNCKSVNLCNHCSCNRANLEKSVKRC